jgi:hypothetical protein
MKNIFSNNNNSKLADKFKSLLSNRGVLYILFVLAIGNLFYLGTSNDIWTIAIFVLTGFLTSFFSKNMVVILCIALVVSSIIKYGISTKMSEGFDGLTDGDKDKIRNAVEGLLGASKPDEGSKKPNKPVGESKDSELESDESFETTESNKMEGNTQTKGNSISGNANVSSSSIE